MTRNHYPKMTEIMSDVNSSNGRFEEDNDARVNAVKLNGVANDKTVYGVGDVDLEGNVDGQSPKDTCVNKKLVMDTANSVDQLYDQMSMTEKIANVVANGHFKSDSAADNVYNANSQPSAVDNCCGNGSGTPKLSSVCEGSVSAPAVSINSSENTTDVQSDLDKTSNRDCENQSVANEDQILDLKTSVIASGDAAADTTAVAVASTTTITICDVAKDSSDSVKPIEDYPLPSDRLNNLEMTCDETTAAELSHSKTENILEDVTETTSAASKDEDILSASNTPEKFKKNRKLSLSVTNITPRRSSRNLNKQKSYAEKDSAECEDEDGSQQKRTHEDDDVEEVTPTDPLAADEPKTRVRNKTIVVSDTKGLVEFASNARVSRSNKKEPTLVIIDTKSILSGRGPVPVSQSSGSTQLLHSSSSGVSAPIPVSLPIPAGALASATRGLPASTSAFSVIPIGLPAQGMYSQYKTPPPQIKPIVVGPASTTVTPIMIPSSAASVSATSVTTKQQQQQHHHQQQQHQQQPQVVLPSLTDDMFVVEAPSFIVPYVYEKPPMKALKGYIEKIEIELKQLEKKEQEEREKEEKELEKDEKDREQKEELEKEDAKVENERCETATANEKPTHNEDDISSSTDHTSSDRLVGDSSSPSSPNKLSADIGKPTVVTAAKEEISAMSSSSTMAVTTTMTITACTTDETAQEASGLQMDVDEETDISSTDVNLDDADLITASSKKSVAPEEKKDQINEKKDETADGKKAENDKKEMLPSQQQSLVAVKEEKKSSSATIVVTDDSKKPLSYFDNPLGKFFMQIGLNLVQEHVQTDLLRSQKRKRDKEGENCSPEVQAAIEELSKTLESSKENNDPFKLDSKKCELCSFKTESLLVMAHHLETPHMKNYTYRCNFCPLEVRSPHDILFHMEAEHNIRGRLERAPAFHQCPNCPFEDNQKGKLTRHLVSCSKKYRAERNQEPPLDWEPPAKIPRVTRNRPPSMSPGNAVYQAAMSGLKQVPQNTLLPKLIPNSTNMKHNMMNANKRPNTVGTTATAAAFVNRFPNAATQPSFPQRSISVQNTNQGMLYRAAGSNSQTQVLLPQSYQLSNAQLYQNPNVKQTPQASLSAAKLLNQPSISITPLPRQVSASQASTSTNAIGNVKPGKPVANSGGKSSFVVCEICDGYIKDLEQLRNHMQWIHKVKIHPKMIYNRPPLNCQKCQYRFFTDQGLERHLLGSHGLVTSSMQEAANKGKDGGRCPVCGRVYQWKLLNHVARDHQMALKPAHLSYKCTVCTATFGMYKQFESHVYSAHSVVAKRAMDTKKPPVPPPSTSSSQNDALLKPLKINDEITIIPQPVRSAKPASKTGANSSTAASGKGKV